MFLSSLSQSSLPLYRGLPKYLLVHFFINLNLVFTFARVFTEDPLIYLCFLLNGSLDRDMSSYFT